MTSAHHEPMVFIATCDLEGHVRGRAVPGHLRDDVLAGGMGWVPANLAITASGQTADNDFGSQGDLRLRPDPMSRCAIPADGEIPGVELYLANQTEVDGAPWECCPRSFLQRALDDLAHEGLSVKSSFEHEFMLTDVQTGGPFSLIRLRAAEPFGSELLAILAGAGLDPENWLPEFGPGQFEVTLKPADGIASADRAILLREIVRDLARRHGHSVTFAPVVHPAQVGNGVHVHLSLTDADGKAVLYDPSRPSSLSKLGGAFAAGIVTHAAALTAFTAPSVISHLRLQPNKWSAGGAFLADCDREALLRICPTPGSADAAARSYNLEYRAADATSNSWLTLGVLLRAGLHGIRAGYSTPAIGAPAVSEVVPLPRSLSEALRAVEEDKVVSEWFDAKMLDTYFTVKNFDIAACANLDQRDISKRVSEIY